MRRYRGDYREIAGLAIGESFIAVRPDDVTVDRHRHSVWNAVNDYTRTRGGRFRCRTVEGGSVKITRINPMDDALAALPPLRIREDGL